MRQALLEVGDRRPDPRLIDSRAVEEVGLAARDLRQMRGELRLEIDARCLTRELYRSRGVFDVLHSFDVGDIVEEPPAACVHQSCVPLHFKQTPDVDLFNLRYLAPGVFLQECIASFGRAIEDDINVVIERCPDIAKHRRTLMLEDNVEFRSQPIERLPQRTSPALMTVRAATVAPAVATPALDAVRAAPRSVLDDFHFMDWRMQREVLAVVRHSSEPFSLDLAHGVRQSHLAELEMMAKRFTVRGHAHELCMLAVIVEARNQSLGKSISAPQQAFKRDVVRHRRVVEE